MDNGLFKRHSCVIWVNRTERINKSIRHMFIFPATPKCKLLNASEIFGDEFLITYKAQSV
jgi:hypothetical protein